MMKSDRETRDRQWEYPETMDQIPYGMITCLADGRELTVNDLSKAHVSVCLFELPKTPVTEVGFVIWDWKYGFVRRGPFPVTDSTVTQEPTGYRMVLRICSEAYAETVRQVADEYSEYIRLKLGEEGNRFSEVLTRKQGAGSGKTEYYPADRDSEFSVSAEEWQDKRNADRLAEKIAAFPGTVALDLDRKQLWNAFVTGNLNDRVPPALRQRYSRIYVGNAFCPELTPDDSEIEAIIRVCAPRERPVGVTWVTGFLRPGREDAERERLRRIAGLCRQYGIPAEAEINDWGYPMLVRDLPECSEMILSYGRLLNKRRRDPRQNYRTVMPDLRNQIGENSLNDASFREFLTSLGISRAETESPGYRMIPTGFPTAVHVPMYQTNTSDRCPLRALRQQGNREWQQDTCGADCFAGQAQAAGISGTDGRDGMTPEKLRYCETAVCLYPDHLNLIGRYNSLFAMDRREADLYADLEYYGRNGVDRIVWNFM